MGRLFIEQLARKRRRLFVHWKFGHYSSFA